MGFVFLCRLTTLAPALYHVSVRQSRCLPKTSFRFRVATDTLVVGYSLPVIRATWGLAPVRIYPCWANKGTHIAFCSGNMSPNIRSISRDYPRSGSTPCIIKMTRKGMLCKHCCYALFQRWPLESPLFLQSVHEWHVRKPSD